MLRAQYRVSRQKYADPVTESTRERVKTNLRDASLSIILPNESYTYIAHEQISTFVESII